MARRSVELAPRALRDLRKPPHGARKNILADLSILKTTPWPSPPKIKKLKSYELYRLRTGEYRSIFEVRGQTAVILRVIDRKDFERILRAL